MIRVFTTQYKSTIETHKHRQLANLSSVQLNILHTLKNNDEITILYSDKNLGPVAISTDKYTRLVLTDHLLQRDTYHQLSEDTVMIRLDNTRKQIRCFIQKLQQVDPSSDDATFLSRCLGDHTRISQFYSLPKIHKLLPGKRLVKGENQGTTSAKNRGPI